VPANTVHEGRNTGTAPVKVVAVFVADKGQPLTRPAP
jgi:oxalate decarboxylase/phosphoglucose isomerase-like protein (cupin superfamily)